MKEILLYKSINKYPTKELDYIVIGKTIIDDEDFEIFNKYRWFLNKGYACRHYFFNINRKTKHIYLHREITNCPKDKFVDHINHNKLDNRRCNLRIVTLSQNQWNQTTQIRSKSSKYKGVYWSKVAKRWQAYLAFHKKRIHLGLFESEIEAAIAYNEKAKELFGKYAKLNEV
jgi:hypothetical protein